LANHKSSEKRIRANKAKELRNKYQAKTTRNAIRAFLELKDKNEAGKQLPKLSSMLDKLAKRNIIHKNNYNSFQNFIRTLFDEITRILNHLLAIACHALDVGSMSSVF